MRQRVALAAVLAIGPRAIVLDEPTSHLDPLQRELFAETLELVASDRIVVLSTHTLDRIAVEASQLLIVDRGGLVYAGEPAGLCAPEPLGLAELTRAAVHRLRDVAVEGAT